MHQIRYTQRICSDKKKIEQFLQQARVGVLGLYDGKSPYAFPVNFVYYNGYIYFHGMGSGKKDSMITGGTKACFTVYEEYGTVTDVMPCHADTSYMSVMAFGDAEKLRDLNEACEVLDCLIEKYLPGFYKQKMSTNMIEKYRSSFDSNPVSVYRINIEEITAKENQVVPEDLYNRGNHEHYK